MLLGGGCRPHTPAGGNIKSLDGPMGGLISRSRLKWRLHATLESLAKKSITGPNKLVGTKMTEKALTLIHVLELGSLPKFLPDNSGYSDKSAENNIVT